LALLCKSLCSFSVNTTKFLGALFLGLRFMWCITSLLGGCFIPVLPDLLPLRSMILSFSSLLNSGIIHLLTKVGEMIIALYQ